MDAETLSLLLSKPGWALLGALPPYDERRAMAIAERLRREGVDPRLIAGALTQSRLRAQARAKFDDFADGMVFTQAGLEQATRLAVGARHARRFQAAGCTKVADLTCGIGGDAMAMAALGLSGLMAGAVVTNLLIGVNPAMPAAFLLVAGLIVYSRRTQLRPLVTLTR